MTADDGANVAVRRLLAKLLETGVVEGVLVQVQEPIAGRLTHALITDPERLDLAQPLSPDMPVNAARLVSRLSRRHPQRKIAVVLRPCEERALAELVKLRQATLEMVFPIVFDCPGATPSREIERISSGPDGIEGGIALLYAAAHEPDAPGPKLRQGCEICHDFLPGALADATLELFGHPSWVGVRLSERLSTAIDLEGWGVTQAKDRGDREREVGALQQVRRDQLALELAKISAIEGDVKTLVAELAECIRCGACRQACPICFCRRCTFDTPTFEREPDDYLRLADKRGVLRMPEDVLLFHLTRLAHVALSCAACGACEDACPRGIRLTRLYAHVAPRVRKPFDYHPGLSLDDPLPLATFEPEELEPR
jgi:formate dehydrogenase subunit beta